MPRERAFVLALLAIAVLGFALASMARPKPNLPNPAPRVVAGQERGVAEPGPPIKRHPLASAASVRVDPNPEALQRPLPLLETASSVTPGQIPVLLAQLPDLSSATNLDLAEDLLGRWAGTDPRGAAAWALALPAGEGRLQLLAQTARVWAENDPSGALAWAKSLPAGQDEEHSLLQVGYELARQHPVEALELGIDLPAGAERDRFLEHSVAQWAENDPDSAWQWATNLPPGHPLRTPLQASVLTAQASANPQLAAQRVAAELPSGPIQDRVAVSVVQRWVQSDPLGAAAWVAAFPQGTTHDAALESLVGIWQHTDPAALQDWRASLPEGTFPSRGADTGGNSWR